MPVELQTSNPKAAGSVAKLVFCAELEGKVGQTDNARDRAVLCIPYQVPDSCFHKREHALDILELCILQHRTVKHDENHAVRIAQLVPAPQTEIEKELTKITRDFWNG